MVNETVSKMQEIIFGILCDIDDYCKENNICYYLSGGTCLGAVRHQGFIPWDDDADLMLPRPDYDRFLKGFAEKFKGKYGVGWPDGDDKWVLQHGRIWDLSTRLRYIYMDKGEIGVFVDIFPIDGLPNSKLGQKLAYGKIKFFKVFRNAAIRNKLKDEERFKLFKRILQVFCKPIGGHRFMKAMEHSVSKYDFNKSKYVAVSLANHYGEKETIERKYMTGTVYLPFNGRMLPVPSGYKKYLTNLYDDYMTIPKDAEAQGFSHLDKWVLEFKEDKKENEND